MRIESSYGAGSLLSTAAPVKQKVRQIAAPPAAIVPQPPAAEIDDEPLQVVSEINGRCDCHYDELCRDRQGSWYYRRTIQQQTCHEDDPHFDEDGERVLLHRLSLEGAILWELGISGHGPLRDAAAALFKRFAKNGGGR